MQSMMITNISPEELSTLLKTIVREEIEGFKQKSEDDKMLSAVEACKLFQPAISRVTLINWTKQGFINVSRIGGRVYYRQRDVLDAVKTLKRYKKGGTEL